MEKLYRFFDFTFDLSEIRALYSIKHKFNDDFNLFGSFVKDFLTIKNNGIISSDEALYDDFVIWLESICNHKKKFVEEFCEYGKYYLMIVFEEIDDEKILSAVSTINACFAIDCYPSLMNLLNGYYHNKIDKNTFYAKLELLTNIVLERYEDIQGSVLSFCDLEDRLRLTEPERVVV